MKRVVWSVSYPRSGCMFLRALIANFMNPETSLGWREIENSYMDIHSTPLEEILKKDGSPLFIKSHYLLRPNYSKVIYLYRDGRDVLISYFFFCRFRDRKEYGFDEFIDKFLEGGEVLLFGTWRNHVKVWLDKMVNVDTLFVKYEDMLGDTEIELKKVLDFAGISYSAESIAKAVKESSFQSMCKKSLAASISPSFRGITGRSGGWRDMLSDGQKKKVWDNLGELLLSLGYSKE